MAGFNGITVEAVFNEKSANNARQVLAKEVSRMAQMINKRMVRLERNNLQMVSAYKEWERQGKPHYGVKGKSYNELQSEYWKLKKIIDDITSTVTGANNYLKDMGKRLGFGDNFKKSQMEDLKANLNGYWRLYHRIEEYVSSLQGEGYNIGSPRIQEMITNYIKENNANLRTIDELNSALEVIVNQVNEYIQNPVFDYDIKVEYF